MAELDLQFPADGLVLAVIMGVGDGLAGLYVDPAPNDVRMLPPVLDVFDHRERLAGQP